MLNRKFLMGVSAAVVGIAVQASAAPMAEVAPKMAEPMVKPLPKVGDVMVKGNGVPQLSSEIQAFRQSVITVTGRPETDAAFNEKVLPALQTGTGLSQAKDLVRMGQLTTDANARAEVAPLIDAGVRLAPIHGTAVVVDVLQRLVRHDKVGKDRPTVNEGVLRIADRIERETCVHATAACTTGFDPKTGDATPIVKQAVADLTTDHLEPSQLLPAIDNACDHGSSSVTAAAHR